MSYRELGKAGVFAVARSHLLIATSTSRHVVDPLVVVNVGQNHRDLVYAGKA